MSNSNSGWPASPANPPKTGQDLAPLAPLADQAPPAERDAGGRFLTGNSGGGRKKGSRNRLSEAFLATIEQDFAEHGADALERLRIDDPATYLRMIASLVPRDLILKREQEPDLSEMSDQEITDMLMRAHRNRRIYRDLEIVTR